MLTMMAAAAALVMPIATQDDMKFVSGWTMFKNVEDATCSMMTEFESGRADLVETGGVKG